MHSTVLYEHPLSERIRTFLRLEALFRELTHHMQGSSAWSSRTALQVFFEILNIMDRGDLRTEIIKELERHTSFLAQLERNPAVDRKRLEVILNDIERLVDVFHEIDGPLGSEFKKHEFINSVMQRSTIPGGTCDFDLPAFHFLLTRPEDHRQHQLIQWITVVEPVQQAVDLILRIIRETGIPKQELAEGGFFQQQLNSNTPCQIVRVRLTAELAVFPEISGNKHRVSIRFLTPQNLAERPTQAKQTIPFDLAYCGI